VVGEAVDRPATVYRPADYTPDRAWPLVLLLHGFGASGFIQNGYLGVSTWVDELGFVLVVPDGTQNPEGQRFWNGTQACCGFGVATVDDVSYLRGLVEETSTLYHIDPTRVYSMGHSNGGFMSFRLACEASDVFVAVASLAGASYADAADCQPAERPVSVLQVHGTQDDTIRYEGGQLFGQPYPSAADTVALHAAVAGCDEAGVDGEPLNMEVNLPGAETTTRTWTQGCAEGTTMALWTIERGSHIPVIGGAGTEAMLRWLLARSR
jgi:polyhydroxybutyrate depolymerase